LTYAALYGAARFMIEFFRDDPRGDILGLTTLTGLSTSQLISLFVGLGGLVLLFIRRRRARGDAAGRGGAAAPASDTAQA
jgi:prolipoprotein diacylglyceryltransferase